MMSKWIKTKNGDLINLDYAVTIKVEVREVVKEVDTPYSAKKSLGMIIQYSILIFLSTYKDEIKSPHGDGSHTIRLTFDNENEMNAMYNEIMEKLL